MTGFYKKFENVFSSIILCIVALMPIYEFLIRNSLFFLKDHFNISLSVSKFILKDSEQILYHLIFVLMSFAIAITEREKEHLNIGIISILYKNKTKSKLYKNIKYISTFIGFVILSILFFASLSMTLLAFSDDEVVFFIPKKFYALFFTFNILVTTIRFQKRLPKSIGKIFLTTFSILIAIFVSLSSILDILTYFSFFEFPDSFYDITDNLSDINLDLFLKFKYPFIFALIISGFLELPLFLVLGGIAIIGFLSTGQGTNIVPFAAYDISTHFTVLSISLFTLSGFILTASDAGKRLITFFMDLLSFFPDGIIIVVVIVSAFFTIFTGASGITILALGTLLLKMLSAYPQKTSLGLITSSGSIGLLFPPSLTIIMYGSTAQISIIDLFYGGLFPGILMIFIVSIFSIFYFNMQPETKKVQASKFNIKNTSKSFLDAIFELFMPLILLLTYIRGITTLIETASLSVLYVFVVEIIIKKDVKLKSLIGIITRCLSILGGILAILFVAKALSSYIIDEQIPQLLSSWIKTNIHSKLLFLLLLNLGLLLVGTLMDIFSAIIVIAPLVIPLGDLFHIDKIHLAMIFLINLEIGFMTPPVGMNLFLSSYTFSKNLTSIYKSILPFLLIQIIALLLITYVPSISTFGVKFFSHM